MTLHINRRHLLAGTGTLVVAVARPGFAAAVAAAPMAGGLGSRPPLKPEQLASYIGVLADGSAVAYWGKIDGGQGTDIGVSQMVAEELDLPAERVAVIQGSTDQTVNQGGASGSTGISAGGTTLRSAAAEARRVLVEMASQALGVPATQLVVDNGVVHDTTDPSKKISYGDLIGGRYFDVVLQWNGKIGNALFVSGQGKVKNPKDYKVVGTSARRRDVAWKVMGTGQYVVDVRVPDMMHARMVMPAIAGAVPKAVDEKSVADIPGAQVVWQKDFLAVVAPREWDAIRASRTLAVTWSDAVPPFPGNKALPDHLRTAKVVKTGVEGQKGDVDASFAKATRVVEATYHWPFQSHASMGPACAVADVKATSATVWTSSQKPHYARDGVAAMLGVPPDAVRGVWMPGPGSYGRNDAGDAVVAAAVISKAIGKPVRLQGMRNEGHGWDPKGPASMHTVRAAVDADGTVLAWDFASRGFSRLDVDSNESDPAQTLAGQLLGRPLAPTAAFATPEESYGFAAKRKTWATIPPLLDRASPLRSSHLRDPLGPQVHFASESFMDELAMATGTDPVAFRLRYLSDARDKAVVKAAADKAGWQPRTGARRQVVGDVAVGQGIAYAQRGGTRVAIVAEVEVNRETGKVWGRRYTVAHDAGLLINPALLRLTIEGNIVQGTSRALWEEVTFDTKNVTSVDWLSYPILDMTEAPEHIEIVLIDHPEIEPTGAGEASMRPIAAAIANAIYDATGVRQRQAPFTPDRVKASWV